MGQYLFKDQRSAILVIECRFFLLGPVFNEVINAIICIISRVLRLARSKKRRQSSSRRLQVPRSGPPALPPRVKYGNIAKISFRHGVARKFCVSAVPAESRFPNK